MSEYNNEKFRELLIEAIGSSSKQDFAKRAGMLPQQLSRYLREDYKVRPSSSTLKKIADASADPVLYDRLLKACGYNETPISIRRGKTFEERAHLNARDMRLGMEELTKSPGIYESIEDFIRTYEMLFSNEDITEIKVGKSQEFIGRKYPYAEKSTFARIKFETKIYECYTWVAIYFAETTGKSVIILGADLDPLALKNVGAMTEEAYEKNKLKTVMYQTRIKEGINSAGDIIKKVLGDLGEEYPYTYVGFGFYLKEEPENFKEFLRAHRMAFCQSEEEDILYEKAMASDNVFEALSDYTGDNDLGAGFGAVIARIMDEETDLRFIYLDPDREVFPGNVPCIMLEGAVDTHGCVSEEYDIEDLKSICNSYASELGIKEYGEVHLQVMNYVHNDHIFTTV